MPHIFSRFSATPCRSARPANSTDITNIIHYQ